jgi:hypothetical protein
VTINAPHHPNAYSWWVQGWANGIYSEWSAQANFTVSMNAPTILLPNGTGSTSQAFVWNRIPSATWYEVWVSNASSTVHSQWYDQTAICVSTLCSTPNITLPSGTYTWWVRGWNPGVQYGAWTTGTVFVVP